MAAAPLNPAEIPRNEIRVGFSFRQDEHREKLKGQRFDTFASHTISFAIEEEISILDNLSVTPVASSDIFDKRKRSQASAPTGRPGDDVAAFNPLVGASYRPVEAVRLCGSVGRKVRFPTMRNLYADGTIGPEGDPDLDEQRATNAEVGASWRAMPDSDVTIRNRTAPALVYEPDELPYRPAHKIDLSSSAPFGFAGENLFDQKYEEIRCIPRPGIAGWMGVTFPL